MTKVKATVGNRVLTVFDDGKFTGTIKSVYRGHRCKMYRVKMDDGGTETITEAQISRIVK